jgi:hypothetical protein
MMQCMEKWLSVLCSLWNRVAAAFPCAQGIDGTWRQILDRRQCRWMLVGFIAQVWLLISRSWRILVPGPAACLVLLTLRSHRLPRCSSQNHDSWIKPVAAVLDSPQVSVVQRPVGHACHATEHSSPANQHEAEALQTLITQGSRISSGRNFRGSTLMNFGLGDWNAYTKECIHGKFVTD